MDLNPLNEFMVEGYFSVGADFERMSILESRTYFVPSFEVAKNRARLEGLNGHAKVSMIYRGSEL